MRWWDSEETVEWFSQRGYQLYKRKIFDGEPQITVYPQHLTTECTTSNRQDPYPYPYIEDTENLTIVGGPSVRDFHISFGYPC
jgi:hypothetical protein